MVLGYTFLTPEQLITLLFLCVLAGMYAFFVGVVVLETEEMKKRDELFIAKMMWVMLAGATVALVYIASLILKAVNW